MAAALRFCFVLALMSAWVSTRASAHGSLRPDHYQWICPQAEAIVLAGVQRVVAQEARMVGSLIDWMSFVFVELIKYVIYN
jgi:hypothetical protein